MQNRNAIEIRQFKNSNSNVRPLQLEFKFPNNKMQAQKF